MVTSITNGLIKFHTSSPDILPRAVLLLIGWLREKETNKAAQVVQISNIFLTYSDCYLCWQLQVVRFGDYMKTTILFNNGWSQAVHIPKALEFGGVAEVEISRKGYALILRSARKTLANVADAPLADADFINDTVLPWDKTFC